MKLQGSHYIEGVDVSDYIRSVTIRGEADEVARPATYGRRSSVSKGDDRYFADIEYETDTADEELTMLFWDKLADADGEVELTSTFQPGQIGASVDGFQGTIVVSSAGFGGTVNEYGTHSATYRFTDRPVKINDFTPAS